LTHNIYFCEKLLRRKASEIITFVNTPEEAVSFCEKNRVRGRKEELIKRKRRQRAIQEAKKWGGVAFGVLVGATIGLLVGGRIKNKQN